MDTIDSRNFIIRPVTIDDAHFLYGMLRVRPTEANISHKEMPTWEEHKRFVKSNPYRYWGVICNQEENIGNAYITKQNEIGIFIRNDYIGKGIGKEVVNILLKRFGPDRFLANIAPGNERSKKFFQQLGFKKIQETYEFKN